MMFRQVAKPLLVAEGPNHDPFFLLCFCVLLARRTMMIPIIVGVVGMVMVVCLMHHQ